MLTIKVDWNLLLKDNTQFLGVWWVVANKFRLFLEFCWVSSGGKNTVQNLLLQGGLWLNYCCSWVVAIYLWLVVGGCGWCWWNNGWLWVVEVKLWLVVSGGSKIITGCGSSGELMPDHGGLWVVATELWLVLGGFILF